jgi:ABC-type multidrug transport system permease subunit
MPQWLQTIAKVNLLYYAAEAVRSFILHSNAGLDMIEIAVDFQFLVGFALVFSLIGILVARSGLRKG